VRTDPYQLLGRKLPVTIKDATHMLAVLVFTIILYCILFVFTGRAAIVKFPAIAGAVAGLIFGLKYGAIPIAQAAFVIIGSLLVSSLALRTSRR